MSLNPSLIITPLSPLVTLYDSGVVARGYFSSYGGYTYHYSPRKLSDNYDNDRILIRQTNTWDNTRNADSFFYNHAVFNTRVYLNDNYWSGDTQVLVIFDIETNSGPQDIQIFVGNELVREESIDGRENIVIVYDFVRNVNINVRPKSAYETLFFYKASVFII